VEMGSILICLLPLSLSCKPNEVLSIAVPAREVHKQRCLRIELFRLRIFLSQNPALLLLRHNLVIDLPVGRTKQLMNRLLSLWPSTCTPSVGLLY